MADKLDPFDVTALEKSVNDSAVRVSTIWVSYLIFALYLVIAAGTVTHRQLFLEDPVKLPVVNIDLPLWGFFFLAPILFVIFHAYVLMQVLLLGRTAAAYNDTLDRAVKPPPANVSMRQRLANTLFAQIFAGSPREREGLIGALLKLMAWVTLAIAPVLVLMVFQFKFLPYHSHFITWTYRLLILIELATVFLLWPLVLDAKRDIEWRRIVRQPTTLASVAVFVLVSMCLATFPGEPHVNLFTGHSLLSVQCERWISQKYDRLDLPRVDVVDDEKLAKIEGATKLKGLEEYKGERTRNFRERDFVCGTFDETDLRRVDFSDAKMDGATFLGAELHGTIFDRARLNETNFVYAQLQNASLRNARLVGATLMGGELQGAALSGARMDGADLTAARMQGADLGKVSLKGTSNNDIFVG
jgi:Pentapeptide repeats (9 copies)